MKLLLLRCHWTYCCNSDTTVGACWRRRVPVESKDDQLPQRLSSEEGLPLSEEPLEALDSRGGSEEVVKEGILVCSRSRRCDRSSGSGSVDGREALGLRKGLNSSQSERSDDDFGEGRHDY